MESESDVELIRNFLLEYCAESERSARESDHHARAAIETGFLAARHAIETTPLFEHVADYLVALDRSLYGVWVDFLTDGADDPGQFRAVAIRVALDEFARIIPGLPHLPAACMGLVEELLPFAAKLHAAGRVDPVAVSMDAHNATQIEGVTPDGDVRPQGRTHRNAVMFLLRNFENDFANGQRERSAVLFHVDAASSAREPVEDAARGNAIAGLLQYASGETWQLVVPYRRRADRWEYFAPAFEEVERPTPSSEPADVLECFMDAFDRQYAAQREAEAGDRSGRHRLIGQGMAGAKTTMTTQDVTQDLGDYLRNCRLALDALAVKFAVEDVDDPDHWRVAGARTMRSDLDRVTQSFTHRLSPALRDEFSAAVLAVSRDFMALIEAHIPVIRTMNADGNLESIAAWTGTDGSPAYKVMPPSDLNEALAAADKGFAAGALKTFGLFQQARNGLGQASRPEEVDTIIVGLEHASGKLVAAFISCDRDSQRRWSFRDVSFEEKN